MYGEKLWQLWLGIQGCENTDTTRLARIKEHAHFKEILSYFWV